MMAMLFARIARSLPLVIFLVLLAVVVYFILVYRSSPNRAKEVLIRLFTWIGIVLSAFFALASLYALLEHNDLALEFMVGFLVVALITLGIARICRAVFVYHNPKYKKKATKTTKEKNRLGR